MKKSYDKALINAYLKKAGCEAALQELRENLFVIRYDKGEFAASPLHNTDLFQIVVEGAIHIYYIRHDGSVYSLANGQKDYLLGDMAPFQKEPGSVYAQANGKLTCLALSISENRERLLNNCLFLHLICQSLTQKIEAITKLDAAPATLKQRVLTYMQYKCENGRLAGVEKAAFQLNCSSRQLQRLLNQYQAEGLVNKLGKGTYQLTANAPGFHGGVYAAASQHAGAGPEKD